MPWSWRTRDEAAALARAEAIPILEAMNPYLVQPDPADPRLTRRVTGRDHEGREVETSVTMERPLTLFLNGQEIVTMMTIGDHPDWLAVGYLLNQNMLRTDDSITAIDFEEELETVVVRTARKTDYEDKLKKKTLTSGCAQGTVFGDLMEELEDVRLDAGARVRTSWLYALSRSINTTPSLYLEAGAIHGCVLCQGESPLVYMEDVGRHNAVDKVLGAALRADLPFAELGLVVSSRAGFEIVQKASAAGVPVVVCMGAATSLAVDAAAFAGIALFGWAGRKLVRYDAATPTTPPG